MKAAILEQRIFIYFRFIIVLGRSGDCWSTLYTGLSGSSIRGFGDSYMNQNCALHYVNQRKFIINHH